MNWKSLLGATLGLAMVVPTAALAGGYELPENGARAVGRAGANFAHVDDASATYFNPAGLSRVNGLDINFSVNLPLYFASFQRDPHIYRLSGDDFDSVVNYERETNQLRVFPAPMFFIAHNFGIEDFAAGFGIYGPSAVPEARWRGADPNAAVPGAPTVLDPTRNEVTRAGGNAYQVVDSSLLTIYPSLTVAARIPNTTLRIGGAIQLVYVDTNVTVSLDGSGAIDGRDAIAYDPSTNTGFTSSENPGFYAPSGIASSGFGITGNFGIQWDIIPQLTFGLNYRPRHLVRTSGNVVLDLPEALNTDSTRVVLADDSARIDVVFPHVLRGGINYRHLDQTGFEVFDLELAFTWEAWSTVPSFRVRAPGPASEVGTGSFTNRTIPPIEIPVRFQNSFSLRLGGDINALVNRETGNGLTLRGGILYESASSPNEYTNLLFTAFQRIGVSVGASYQINRWGIDLGAMYLHSPTRQVTDGDFRIQMPLWVCNDPASHGSAGLTAGQVAAACQNNRAEGLDPRHAVNNGEYRVSYLILSTGVRYQW